MGATAFRAMWIQFTITDDDDVPTTRRLKTPAMDAPVEFNDSGTAQVTRDVGEHLVSEFDHITPVEDDADGATDGDAGDTPDASQDDEDTPDADA